ncbi:LacI family DNA-binding transcriptional regulator [Planktotalea sp.]|uniref:LacI family DNA-binding transcriptional regulator n=1 Tax=Planktotalea sp. TaxID=2029877 RepID=UPI003299095A
MKNPTLSDVAEIAGVSYATADRVINKRGNVAQKSVRKVEEAMTAIGYVRNVAAANLSRGRIYRLAFLLPKGRNAFFNQMRVHLNQIANHMQSERVTVDVIELAAFSTEGLKNSLQSVIEGNYDGVAAVGLQNDALSAPLKRLREQGVAVIGLVSDLPLEYRAAYIGIDNKAAGRTAARLIGMSHGGSAGRIQLLAGSLEARDHEERVDGFREVIFEDFPNLEILDPIMTHDDASAVRSATADALCANPAITALYNVGAGNSGLIAALEDHSTSASLCCAAHELTAHTRAALQNKTIDFVIDQRPDMEINRAFTVLRALIDARDIPPMPDLVPTIYVRDNLPTDAPITPMKEA